MNQHYSLIYFIYTLPVVGSLFYQPRFDIKIYLALQLLMFVVEIIRQYLWPQQDLSLPTPKRLFFFGATYNNTSINYFFNTQPIAQSAFKVKKVLLLALVYGLSLLCFKLFSSEKNLSPLSFIMLSTFISTWILAADSQALNRLLVFNLFFNIIYFLNLKDKSLLGFFTWLWVSLIVHFILQKQTYFESQKIKKVTLDALAHPYILSKSLIYITLFYVVFNVFNFLVIDYSSDNNEQVELAIESAATSQNIASAQNSHIKKMKKTKIDPKTLEKLAATSLKMQGLFRQTKQNKFKLIQPNSQQVLDSQDLTVDELSELKGNIMSNNSLSTDDIEKLIETHNKINNENEEISKSAFKIEADNSRNNSKTHSINYANAPNSSDFEQNLLQHQKLNNALNSPDKNQNKNLDNSNEDLSQEYLDSRKKLSAELDRLLVQKKSNELNKEKFKILNFIDKIITNLRSFIFMLIIFILLVFILSKNYNFFKNKTEVNKLSLPKKSRILIKDIYKTLLKATLTPTEEVLKSYYLIEIAMKEIELPRTVDLPPQNYYEQISEKFPFLSSPLKTPTILFNKVLYGEKTPQKEEIILLRSSLNELMKKLQVI